MCVIDVRRDVRRIDAQRDRRGGKREGGEEQRQDRCDSLHRDLLRTWIVDQHSDPVRDRDAAVFRDYEWWSGMDGSAGAGSLGCVATGARTARSSGPAKTITRTRSFRIR